MFQCTKQQLRITGHLLALDSRNYALNPQYWFLFIRELKKGRYAQLECLGRAQQLSSPHAAGSLESRGLLAR
jgi:hypothetical protein